ncbi:hypothetical protein FKM82_005095 [Ascaphus truei]
MKQTFEELQRLHGQVTLLSVEMTALKEDRDHLLALTQNKEHHEQLLRAIKERDEAMTKKNAVELALGGCRDDLMSLNTQLLDAIQQKLNLSQQLEAWQVGEDFLQVYRGGVKGGLVINQSAIVPIGALQREKL